MIHHIVILNDHDVCLYMLIMIESTNAKFNPVKHSIYRLVGAKFNLVLCLENMMPCLGMAQNY